MVIKPSRRLGSLPPYAFAEIDKKVAALRSAGVDVIDFGVGDPTESVPPFVVDNLTDFGKKHATSGYPSYVGSDTFRAAAAAYMRRRFAVVLDPEREICADIGSKEAVFNFPEGFVEPGDIVICPSPGYPPMKTGTIFAEGTPYFVPLLEEKGFLIDYTSIPEEIARHAKIIWINYPNSPTGAIATREYYTGLTTWAQERNIIVASDEGCYIDIYFGEPPPSILEVAREGVVAFYSLSKRNNMTGYRVGFVCGDERIVSIFKQLKTNVDSGVAHVMQEAAIAALADDSHVETMRALYRAKRDALLAGLSQLGLPVREVEATFYVWQKVPKDDIVFAERLLHPSIGIVVTPGSLISDPCEGNANPGKGYVRFALVPSLSRVEEAVRRLQTLSWN
ncbi:aminotransferase class I/II-fold pyridoxal phosphate-dependent enzyme [Candidatus Kaiserbacteria bacterium]|nr:aminotransferase class I/II-fold pyridoxal phosphate-dependent enzyme [Candidatus Kaiserbacteria bacterium]